MRGVFSVDMVLALFLLTTFIGAVAPDWEEVRDATRVAICSYLTDANSYFMDIASDVGGVVIDNIQEGGIRYTSGEGIFIWIVSREVSC